MSQQILGWDVGGAHLKLARLDGGGRLASARILPCPLWRGLGELDAALDTLAPDIPDGTVHAVTMTGELVDLWPDRASGVVAIAQLLAGRFGDENLAVYAGARGFVGAGEAAAHWSEIASANWRATAEALAAEGGDGLLVDIGSTTADLIPFSGGRVLALGATDAGRLAAQELIYLGAARTPVMAMAPRLPFGGAWVQPMAEHFATSADVFRLTGDLPDGADLHPAADSGEKTAQASARRLLRIVGADLDAQSFGQAQALARYLAEASLRRLADAAALILSRPDAPAAPVVCGAGVGRFLARRLAERLGLLYRDVGAAWAAAGELADIASDCAPAVAVARLSIAARGPR